MFQIIYKQAVFLRKTSLFSCYICLETKSLIAHGPDDICGVLQSSSTNSNNVVLGCLATKHTDVPGNMMYSWYHNDNLVKQGKKACLLYVFHPGKYKCKVTMGNQHQFSKEVDVLYSSKDVKIVSAGKF